MPSSTAALVALSASSILSFLSFSSVSVAAPTLTTATPPESLASLSCSFSLSNSESLSSISFLIDAIRAAISSLSPLPPTITVLSLSTLTVVAVPRRSSVASLRSYPTSSLTTVPPVRIAISSIIAFLLSPKPGALTASTSMIPLSLLITSVARASPSTSSAMIISFLPCLTTCSSSGSSSWMFEIFLSVRRM